MVTSVALPLLTGVVTLSQKTTRSLRQDLPFVTPPLLYTEHLHKEMVFLRLNCSYSQVKPCGCHLCLQCHTQQLNFRRDKGVYLS